MQFAPVSLATNGSAKVRSLVGCPRAFRGATGLGCTGSGARADGFLSTRWPTCGVGFGAGGGGVSNNVGGVFCLGRYPSGHASARTPRFPARRLQLPVIAVPRATWTTSTLRLWPLLRSVARMNRCPSFEASDSFSLRGGKIRSASDMLIQYNEVMSGRRTYGIGGRRRPEDDSISSSYL